MGQEMHATMGFGQKKNVNARPSLI